MIFSLHSTLLYLQTYTHPILYSRYYIIPLYNIKSFLSSTISTTPSLRIPISPSSYNLHVPPHTRSPYPPPTPHTTLNRTHVSASSSLLKLPTTSLHHLTLFLHTHYFNIHNVYPTSALSHYLPYCTVSLKPLYYTPPRHH